MTPSSGNKQTRYIIVGLVAGLIAGHFLYDPQWSVGQDPRLHRYSVLLSAFDFFGMTIFMGALKMLIIPLVATSVFAAVTSIGDFRQLGRLGGYTLFYYFSTMLIAVTLGIVVVTAIEPGVGMNSSDVLEALEKPPVSFSDSAESPNLSGAIEHMIKLMIPENIFASLAAGQTLSVIVFFLFFGIVTAQFGDAAKPLVELAQVTFQILMKMIEYVLWLAPVGVFCLLAWSIARIGLSVFGSSIGSYMITVIIGLAIHSLIILPLILYLVSYLRGSAVNPFVFLLQMKKALITAIGTDSSSATLPVTISCAEQSGVKPQTAGLVLPLGATINMDGTALYEAVAVIFMAQAFGIELGLLQLVLIAITATLAAVGAAGIPSAGLVTMVIVLDVTNESLASFGPEAKLIPVAAIGLIIGVDRLLDMLRTAVNVWGDAVGAKLISTLEE